VTTDELIVSLAQDADAVRPLPPPSARLARWTGRAVIVTAVSALVIGVRPDASALIRQPAFAGLSALTLLTAVFSAACALVLSIPGAERTPAQRALPCAAAGAWIALLLALMRVDGHVTARLLALPVHPLCIIEIAGLGLIPGWSLFAMVKRAAPLQASWAAALATLAAAAIGAAGTQFLCPIDDPAHQLVGHVVPVVIFAALGAVAFSRSLDSFRRQSRG
jgi:hypothetical protein